MPDFEVEIEYIAKGKMPVSAEDEEMAAAFAKDCIEEGDYDVSLGGDHECYEIKVISVKPIKTYEVECTHIAYQKTTVEACSEEEAKEKVKNLLDDPDEYYKDPEVVVTNITEIKEEN